MLLRKKEEIEAWLNKYKIENYELIEDQEYGYMVNVNNNVFLNHKNLKSLEVKFNKINGYFDCCHNELTSLEGCPKIIKEYFDCSSNKLKSLKGCPEIVDGNFNCSFNELTSLKGAPEIVFGSFACYKNKLISLEYCPGIVYKNFNSSYNELITLKGAPKIVKNFFSHNNNLNLESLRYLPQEVTENCINISQNKQLGDLQNILDFNELREKINIPFEKEKLLDIINQDNIQKNNKKNSINKL